ncbi:MAG: exodeoxyribonuclease V subunit beta [Pseudomonadota bacterium]
MTNTARVLDIATFALHGSQLIEASAGTGKTWTIAMLYLRLILGPHPGAVAAIERPLHPREILVVTFTEAATQELRDRIRRRLGEAATVFADGQRAAADFPDPLRPIAQLRDLYPPAHWGALAQRLHIAADAMDDAAISTLHGWCQRVLREQAFLSGVPFALTLRPDVSDLIDEAVADLWRLQVQTLPAEQAQAVVDRWHSPDALGKAVRPLLPHAAQGTAFDPALAHMTVAQVLQVGQDQRRAALARLKAELAPCVQAAGAAIDAHGLWRVLGQPASARAWMRRLSDWVNDPDDDGEPSLGTGWERLTREHLLRQPETAVPAAVAALPLWDALARLRPALKTLPCPMAGVLRLAAVWVQRRVEQRLAERDEIGFDGLLTRLAQALDGPLGPALAARTRARYPAALVDEFQDTDPVQLRILQRIYGLEAPAEATALILIGDPKQAIYAFRQADVHSYLQARRACATRLWRLDTNRRSSHAYVAAVNHLFEQAERRTPQGAFRMGSGGDHALPFVPVHAHGRPQRWCDAGNADAPALTIGLLPTPAGKPWTQTALRDAMAAACADRVARWLQTASAGQTGFRAPDGRWQPLRPDDIAVLVNDRFEAAALQAALQARGVASVFLSDRESVYASPEAEDLQRWLHACAHPGDAQAVRAALATPSLGWTPTELEAAQTDDGRWEALLARFAHYHTVWQRHGVLPAVRALLHDFHVPQRLLHAHASAPRGERALTNLLHLAELLQSAAAPASGRHEPAAVLQHLLRARHRALAGQLPEGDDSATPQLRLESERDRVILVTVHKSKGLEYPVVCYPFAMHARVRDATRARSGGVGVLTWHDADGRLQVTFSDEGERWLEAQTQAEAERWAEDLRRLYVALTRACHAAWIGLAATDQLPVSALGHLLGITALPAGAPDAALEAALASLLAPGIAIAVQRCQPDASAVRCAPSAPGPQGAPVARAAWAVPAIPRPRWWIASYSALVAPATPAAPPEAPTDTSPDAPASARDEQLVESAIADDGAGAALEGTAAPGGDSVPPSATPPAAADTAPWHRLPRGALTGTALHAVLEDCARTGFARAVTHASALQQRVERVLAQHGWPGAHLATDSADLAQWVQAIVHAPLPLPAPQAPVTCLAALHTVQPEWEFWLGTARLDAARLDAWVRQATLDNAPRPALREATLHGMLKGFVDLVFEHQGRYYVLDHKSNALGAADEAYTHDAVQRAVLEHRYELQAVLYLVALHRLLRQRLPRYQPAAHLGGALCVFWRGVQAPTRGVFALPAPVELIERLDAALAGHPAATPEAACA